ncbi:hypothetical protein FGIG_04331 [Fasciola gigantica]|uniref:Uncharacterized protein n=1 Tax=Fasciola gigantica TaxID=46835 RepID=A0A504YHS3_FASGI|nr:hypothetical protein FGIG_04331 [Fasciola gigantica]
MKITQAQNRIPDLPTKTRMRGDSRETQMPKPVYRTECLMGNWVEDRRDLFWLTKRPAPISPFASRFKTEYATRYVGSAEWKNTAPDYPNRAKRSYPGHQPELITGYNDHSLMTTNQAAFSYWHQMNLL